MEYCIVCELGLIEQKTFESQQEFSEFQLEKWKRKVSKDTLQSSVASCEDGDGTFSFGDNLSEPSASNYCGRIV